MARNKQVGNDDAQTSVGVPQETQPAGEPVRAPEVGPETGFFAQRNPKVPSPRGNDRRVNVSERRGDDRRTK